jgi:hypothetical protein
MSNERYTPKELDRLDEDSGEGATSSDAQDMAAYAIPGLVAEIRQCYKQLDAANQTITSLREREAKYEQVREYIELRLRVHGWSTLGSILDIMPPKPTEDQ